MRRWKCFECGAETDHVITKNRRSSEYGDETVLYCPWCGEENCLKEMEQCPTCDNGWKLPGEKICEKCRLRSKAEMARFFRGYAKPVREYFDDLLDGASVEEFV